MSLCLIFSGCDKTKKTIQETKQGYIELERIIIDIKSALSTTDWSKAKQAAAKADEFLQTRALSWYVQILIAEEKDGIPAAQALLSTFRQSDSISPAESKALDAMEKYFTDKGDNRSIDYLFLIAIIAAENKSPHIGADVVASLQAKYHQSRNLPVPTTNSIPSTNTP